MSLRDQTPGKVRRKGSGIFLCRRGRKKLRIKESRRI